MPLTTEYIRNSQAVNWASEAVYIALFSTVPTATPGTELPGVARVLVPWAAPVNGVLTVTGLDIPGIQAGQVVRGFGYFTALTGGTYVDGKSLPEQAFNSPGTATMNLTHTES